MREPVAFFVEGQPKGQPRARACVRGKRAGVYDPGTADAWKAAIAEVWRNVVTPENAPRLQPFENAVSLRLNFYFRRPKGHYGTGKNAGKLKATAPVHHTGKPDCDNLGKAVMDVLTRLGAWTDDALVSRLGVVRAWAGDCTRRKNGIYREGCEIVIREII